MHVNYFFNETLHTPKKKDKSMAYIQQSTNLREQNLHNGKFTLVALPLS